MAASERLSGGKITTISNLNVVHKSMEQCPASKESEEYF